MNTEEPTQDMIVGWAAWVQDLPERARVVAERFFPWKLYRIRSSGHRVKLCSIDEPEDPATPVTLKVVVSGEYNFVAFDRTVFGVPPEDLEECDLPSPDEILGSLNLTKDEAKSLFLNAQGLPHDPS